MTKKIFLFAMAAIAMASCSNDETLDINQGKGIGFRISADKATRGIETKTDNLKEIYVTAVDANDANLFKDLLFSEGEGGIFSSNPLYYWPGDGSNLTFHAYAPAAEKIGATVTTGATNNKVENFSPAEEINDQIDLVYVTATGNKTNEAEGVTLKFDHMLSQISIKAKNTNEGYIYKVAGVKIGQPVSKGSLDFTTKDWTWTQEKAIYAETYKESAKTLNANAQSLMKTEGNHAMLIPQQLTKWNIAEDPTNAKKGAYLSVLVNITTKDGAQVYPSEGNEEDYAWAAVAIDTEWKPGSHYVYTLDFSEGAGNVDPDEKDPEEPGEEILGGPIKLKVEVNL